MTKITISKDIFDGNLGDGWRDNAATADALADYTRSVWESDLKKFSIAGHEVVIDVSVHYGTSGFSHHVSVWIDDNGDEEHGLTERKIEELLTPESLIWDQFCTSEQA